MSGFGWLLLLLAALLTMKLWALPAALLVIGGLFRSIYCDYREGRL